MCIASKLMMLGWLSAFSSLTSRSAVAHSPSASFCGQEAHRVGGLGPGSVPQGGQLACACMRMPRDRTTAARAGRQEGWHAAQPGDAASATSRRTAAAHVRRLHVFES